MFLKNIKFWISLMYKKNIFTDIEELYVIILDSRVFLMRIYFYKEAQSSLRKKLFCLVALAYKVSIFIQ